jgi:hypothetical protein
MTYAAGQAADTDFRVDDIRSIMPERLTQNYYSTNFVKNSDDTYSSEFDADDEKKGQFTSDQE